MPGDPKECRDHAKECLRMAEMAISEDARATFNDLAKTWLRLAYDLEQSQALINAFRGDGHDADTSRSPLVSPRSPKQP
jgi:hypothetical protein